MERRTFLLGAGLVSMGARAANDTVGIGVIGLGGRGRDHLKYYSKLPDARVVAVCDVNQAQTERAAQIVGKLGGSQPHVHQDLRKLRHPSRSHRLRAFLEDGAGNGNG